VNPADIPTTDKERKQKEDRRDSRKLAKELYAGQLQGNKVWRRSGAFVYEASMFEKKKDSAFVRGNSNATAFGVFLDIGSWNDPK
jgi:hypothetical protein